ncbi:hypothetical protein J4E93_001422 [Alternaria ventricosa]|uniref:uncharacterized protein n=1 Tax=Alternaria ventricosa TaxID=1187951 RepID=UPI0020C3C589|nr:uncharacterized protein J4E93_001422 [Alternaria ventricosa]KAI4653655.1 hypothetical protein J4E93_001422 [Alternaria ventricosa]
MRAFLVKSAGLALYVHDLQSGTLTLTHERANKEPKVHILDEEDFDDGADEFDIAILQKLESGLETSAVGLSLRLVKNDGVLKIAYRGKGGGVVDWKLQGLDDGKMVASASTQTDPQIPPGQGDMKTVLPRLSISMIQRTTTNPTPERIETPVPRLFVSKLQTMTTTPTSERVVQPPLSGLSIISTIETHPVGVSFKRRKQIPASHATGMRKSDPKHRLIQVSSQPINRKLARDPENLTPWPNHLFMAVNTNQERIVFFAADCSAPGYQIWGSDIYQSLDPIGHYSSGPHKSISIPTLPAETTMRFTSPSVIIRALRDCINRASPCTTVSEPIAEPDLLEVVERGLRYQSVGSLNTAGMVKWITAIQEMKKREALKRKAKLAKEENGNVSLKRGLDVVEEEREDKKVKVESGVADEMKLDSKWLEEV